jgi:formiminoglutamate deiminase
VSQAIFSELALLPDGWASKVRLIIENGRFAHLQRDAAASPEDERVAVLLPGMSNVHSHGFQRGMAGLTEYRGPEADNFWSWRELMYRFVGRMTPDDIEAITAMAYVEMLESGYTRVGEFHYVHHDVEGRAFADPAETATRIVAAAHATGIALTLLPVFYAHSNFGGQPPAPGQRRFITTPDQYANLVGACRRLAASLPDARVGVAPHSLRAVTPEQLQVVTALAGGGPIHIHAAEQVREVEDCRAWSGTTPVQWLLDHAALDEHWCLVHATHLTREEIAGLAASGAVAGFCPVTEANLGDGIAPASSFMAAGGVFGIGTDSNVLISVREELRQLEYSQRLRDRSRNVLATRDTQSTGHALFAGAQRGGSRALGVEQDGAIVEGAPADCFSLATESALPTRDALLDSFIFAPAPRVQHLWRGGRKVVSGGVHCARPAVRQRYDRSLAGLLA